MRFTNTIGAALAAASLLAVSIAPSWAADAIVEQPPEPPLPAEVNQYLWSGSYIGVYGGYGWLKSDIDPGPSIDGIDGIKGGGYAGYNYQFTPNWVAGLEGQFGLNGGENNFGGYTVEQGWDASLRGRLGYAFENSLLYGAAGLAGTHAEVLDATGSDTNVHLGWTIGAGLETIIADNVSARVEYDFSTFGSERYTLGASTPEVSFDDHSLKVGIGLKF